MKRLLAGCAVLLFATACGDLGPTVAGPSLGKATGPSTNVATVVPAPGFELVTVPATFVRNPGPPQTQSMNVTHPDFSEFVQPLVLHFINGMDDGTGRTSNATISLNGTEVFAQQSFSKDTQAGDIEVAIVDGSTLTVRVTSSPGSEVTVWVEGQRNAPPPPPPHHDR